MNKKLIILMMVLCLSIFLFGCTKISENETLKDNENGFVFGPGDYKFDINQNNLERYYLVHVPKSYDGMSQVPVIFVFHGGGSNTTNVKKTSEFDSLSDKENFIVVYPQGIVDPANNTNAGTWNTGPFGGGYSFENDVNDIEFFDLILDEIKNNFFINENKIYATGISMGGMISYRLACQRSNKIAAIAPIAATITLNLDDCDMTNPVSVLHFHGTSDKFIPFFGGDSDASLPKILVIGGNYLPVDDAINFVNEKNNCDSSPVNYFEENDVTCKKFENCSNYKLVAICVIEDGGHTWPGSKESILLKPVLGKTTNTINATKEIWDFFKQFSLN